MVAAEMLSTRSSNPKILVDNCLPSTLFAEKANWDFGLITWTWIVTSLQTK